MLSLEKTQTLNDALEVLDSIPWINAGGCGISALAIYRWCKANGVEVSDRPFVILCEDIWEKQHNDEIFQYNDVTAIDPNEIAFPHIVIEIGGELYDSGGSDVQERWEWIEERQDYQLNERELLALINVVDGWNTAFNREHVYDIEDYLGIDLSDVVIE